MLKEYRIYTDNGTDLGTVWANDADEAMRIYSVEDSRAKHYRADRAEAAN